MAAESSPATCRWPTAEAMMAVERELSEFVRSALTAGAPRTEIEAALGQAGWRRDQVQRAMQEFADIAFPVPVPRPRPYLSAREAFLYLVLFATLYDTALSLGGLFYTLIDRAFPDPAQVAATVKAFQERVRFSVAQLIVAFPVFVWLTLSIRRAIARDPNRRASRVRKWLTYLTLFLGACVLIGDVATLAYRVLGGETTTRFLLKVFVVGAVAGTIFGTYLHELRVDEADEGEPAP